MNSEHTISRVDRAVWICWMLVFFTLITSTAAVPALAMSSALNSNSRLDGGAQGSSASTDAEFSSAVVAMANAGPGETASLEKLEKKALEILDGLILSALSENNHSDLDTLNGRLANLGTHDHAFGETYRVVRLGGKPLVFALVADFGLGAPSAIRLYTEQESPARFALAGEIDRFTQKEMLDDSLELLPVPLPDLATGVVFITVGGRTDALQTGIFTAWRFDGKQLTQLWSSDLISHSAFQMSGENLVLTYCHDPADQETKTCRNMVREKYVYSVPDSQWRLISTEPIPNPKN